MHFELLFEYLLFRRVRDHGEATTLSNFLVRRRVERLGAHRKHGLAMRLNGYVLFLGGTAVATALQ